MPNTKTFETTSIEQQKVQVLRDGVQVLRVIANNLQQISATLQRMEVKRK